jgi:hypothetical protein
MITNSTYIKGRKQFFNRKGLAFVAYDVFTRGGRKALRNLMPEGGYAIMRCGRYCVVVSRYLDEVVVCEMYTDQDFEKLLVSSRFWESSKQDRQTQRTRMGVITRLERHPMREKLLAEIAAEERFYATATPIEVA